MHLSTFSDVGHTKPDTSDNLALAERLSPRARALWAKSDYDAKVEWLPLYLHISDSAAVAATLWDHFLPTATQRVVAAALDGNLPLARKVAIWLAASHDLGKASPAFTCQMDWLRLKAEDAGLPFHPSVERNRRQLRHEAASYFILREWLKSSHGFSRKIASTYASVPLGHHGDFSTPPPEHSEPGSPLLGDKQVWWPTQRELACYTASFAGLIDDDFAELTAIALPQPSAISLTGLTILADWIASNSEFFPLRSTPREPGAAANAMARLGLPPPWRAEAVDNTRLFSDHLDLPEPRPLQTGIVELARRLTEPELLILEAPTGEGKTKAALAASEVMAAKFDLGGVLFALPTQATSDGILTPVHEWLSTIIADTNVSLGLAHGKAQFNPEYANVRRMSRVYDPDGSGNVVAHWFLTGRGKLATMSDFVVGTIDQLLLGALRAKHVALRHLGVAGKVVVIDEVHAADTFMRRYLCRMLTWLAAYNVPVIAMSATLTPSIRRELITAYNDGRGRATAPIDDDAIIYPRITYTTDHGADVVALPASSRTSSIQVDELPGDVEAIALAALSAAVGGGNVAVICDTVRRAQDVYRTLRTVKTDNLDLRLLHSRFLSPDRLHKEEELRVRLGPAATAPNRPLIVVSTQVIEQSLDIDFDVMFSDVAPLDLLIQRAGRLHRHRGKDADRPAAHRTARLVLTGFTRTTDGAPDLDRGCTKVYGAAALLRALATLDEHFAQHAMVASPDDVAHLVTRAYETIGPPPGWEDVWATSEEKDRLLRADQRRRADQYRLPPPSRRLLTDWTELPGAADASGERGAAQVRDAEDSIEVVVVQRIDGRLVIPQWAAELGGAQVDMAAVVDEGIALAASKNTLRLPGFLGVDQLGDQLISELEDDGIDTWQNSKWLRGMLPLILDTHGDAAYAGFNFHYDTDLGLLVTHQEHS